MSFFEVIGVIYVTITASLGTATLVLLVKHGIESCIAEGTYDAKNRNG